MMSYGFQIRFYTPPGHTIRGVEPELQLEIEGINSNLTIRKLPHKTNHTSGTPETFVLEGSGFESEMVARDCGHRLKQALVAYGVISRLGIDAGQDRVTSGTSEAIKEQMRERFSIQLRDIVHGLDVYAESLPVSHLEFSATGSVRFLADNFQTELSQQFQRPANFSRRLSLALELYNLTAFQPATKARFLSLITVIEVLSTRQLLSVELIARIEQLIDYTRESNLPNSDVETLVNGLGNLKRESIARASYRLVLESLGPEKAELFKKHYSVRSNLVHTGQTQQDFVSDLEGLEDIVQNVLMWHMNNDN